MQLWQLDIVHAPRLVDVVLARVVEQSQRHHAPADQRRSPTTTGKIERFHQTLRRALPDDARPFTSVLEAQAALDDRVREYNAARQHQALDTAVPVTPADRFRPVPDDERSCCRWRTRHRGTRRPRQRPAPRCPDHPAAVAPGLRPPWFRRPGTCPSHAGSSGSARGRAGRDRRRRGVARGVA
jgi:hypothetical protein